MANTLATEKQASAIKQRMAEIRTELPYSADEARQRVRQLADWKYHLAKHPLPVLAAASVVGYLLVPSRRTPERVVIERPVAQPQHREPAKKGLVGGVLGAIATIALKQAASVASTQVTGLLTSGGKGS